MVYGILTIHTAGCPDMRQNPVGDAGQVVSDLDIYRSAHVLIREHGQDALIEAAMRADAMLEKGDLDGYAVWKRILRAVGELQRMGPARGARAL